MNLALGFKNTVDFRRSKRAIQMAITQFIRDRERQQMVYCLASERRPFHDLSRGIVIIKKRLVIANVLNDRQLSLSNFSLEFE
jgi:hypothetical protein